MGYCKVPDKTQDTSLRVDTTKSIFGDEYKDALYNRLTSFVVGDIFRKYAADIGWTPDDLVKTENAEKLAREIKNYYQRILVDNANNNPTLFSNISDEVTDDIYSIYTNFPQFIGHYFRYNPIINNQEFSRDEEFFTDDTQVNVPEENEDLDPGEQNEQKGKEFERQGNEQTPFELADRIVKVAMRLLPKGVWNEEKKDVDVYLDENGLPDISNYDNVYKLILIRTAGIKDHQTLVDVLTSVDTLRIVPEAKFLAEMLKVDKTGKQLSANEYRLLSKFYQAFSKPKVQIQSVVQSKGNMFLVDEIPGNILKIRELFTSNFQTGKVNENVKQYLKKDEVSGFYLAVDLPERPGDLQKRLDFLSLIGINLSGRRFLDTPLKNEQFETLVEETSNYLYNALLNRFTFDPNLKIFNPIKQLREPFANPDNPQQSIKGEGDSLDRLIDFESRYSSITPTLSARNAEGELQWMVSLDNQITIATNYLNASLTLDELYEYSPFRGSQYNPLFRTSYIIEYLFDENGKRRVNENGEMRTVDLTNLSGLKKEVQGRTKATLERKMSDRDKIMQDFAMILSYGKTDIMRTSTSHSFFTLGLKNERNKNQLYFSANGFLDSKEGQESKSFILNSAFRKQIFNYLEGEKKRIASYPQKKDDYPELPTAYGDWSLFSDFFEDRTELAFSIRDNDLTEDSKVFADFMKEYNTFMEGKVDDFIKVLDKNNISYQQLITKTVADRKENKGVTPRAFIRSFIANTQIQNIEFSILYTGDPLFYKEFHRRIKALSSTGDLAITSDLYKDYMESDYEKAFYAKYSLAGTLKTKLRDNSKNFRTKTLIEFKPTADYEYNKDILIQGIIASKIRRDGTAGKYTYDYVKNEVLKDVSTQKPADGQGYGNLDFFRELFDRFGISNSDSDVAFKYEGLIFKRDIAGETLSVTEEEELTFLEEMIRKNPEKYTIPVLKMSYFGSEENTKVDVKAFDKFSVSTILPSFARNHPVLKQLLQDMVKKQYGYVKYQTGTKLYTRTPVDISQIASAEPDLYSTELLRLQIKPKIEQSVSTSIPTQQLRLILLNLFNNGEAVSSNIKELYEEYKSVLGTIQGIQLDEFLKDLGIDPSGDELVVDYKRLGERLTDLAKKQGYNSNILKGLNLINEENVVTGVLEKSGYIKQITDVIGGLADNMLRKFQFPGGDFILVTNANLDRLNFYQYGENGTILCDCRITLTKEFSKLLNKVHPDGEVIGTRERLNALLKNNKKWVEENKKSLTIVLDRVPTQGFNSMDTAIVVEFLPSTWGNVIILPDEITYKGGLDFDYDKEKVLTPSFTDQGDYIDSATAEKIMKDIKELEDEYSELRGMAIEETFEPSDILIERIFNRKFPFATDSVPVFLEDIENKIRTYYSLKRSLFHQNANKIIDIYSKILLSPEVFLELVSPLSSESLKNTAIKLAELTGKDVNLPIGSKIYDYVENLKVKGLYFDSKTELGPFAVSNSQTQIILQNGLKINDSYNFYGKQYKITNQILTEDELAKIKKGNQYTIGLRDSIDGVLKQFIDSEAITATVDAEKDPFFALTGISWYNIGVVNLLKTMGYPFDRILYFINQPVIEKYNNLLKIGTKKQTAISQIFYEMGVTERITEEKLMIGEQFDLLKEDPTVKIESSVLLDDDTIKVKYSKESPPSYGRVLNLMRQVDAKQKIAVSSLQYLNKVVNYEDDITEQDLIQNLGQGVRTLNSMDIRMLSHFFIMDRANTVFRSYQRYFNFITTKTSTPTDIAIKRKQRAQLEEEAMFSEEDIQKIEKDSIVSSYINTDILDRVFTKLFPLLSNKNIKEAKSLIYDGYTKNREIFSQRDLRNLPKTIDNDIITAIIFNFNLVDAETFIERNMHLLIKEAGKATAAEKLEELKATPLYTYLAARFPVFERFIVSKHELLPNDINGLSESSLGRFINNIQLLKDNTETPVEQESIIKQLRDLMNYEVTQFSPQDNATYNTTLKSFVENLFDVGILQSGINPTYIGFSEYIPHEYRTKIYKNAINNFEKFVDNDLALRVFTDSFVSAFKRNNPRYFPFVGEAINNNNYSYRFKLYDLYVPKLVEAGLMEPTPEVKEVTPEMNTVKVKMSDSNTQKILNWEKTTTIRSNEQARTIGLEKGESAIVQFGGQEFIIRNRGSLKINEAGGKEAMLKSEGVKDESEFMYKQTKDWVNGKGRLFVYDIILKANDTNFPDLNINIPDTECK